ncbi:MAG: hypothetical protein JWM76_1577 [Pseudonocardiales bacterium]|nr:hypothetical protein [Pseudonocardiales bacterium]
MPRALTIEWPIDPHVEVLDRNPRTAWVVYKIETARYYIDILEHLKVSGAGFSRFVGVERAIDGAWASLCGAFDAAYRSLVKAVYAAQGLPYPDGMAPPRDHKKVLAGRGGQIANLIAEINTAQDRSQNPRPWLVQLQDLRNETLHEQSLARHIHVEAGVGTSIGYPCPTLPT